MSTRLRLGALLAVGLAALAGCGGGGKTFDRPFHWEHAPITYRFPDHTSKPVPPHSIPAMEPMSEKEKQEVRNAYTELHRLGAPEFVEVPATSDTADVDILKPLGGVPSAYGDKNGLTTLYPIAHDSESITYAQCLLEDGSERDFRRTAWHEAGHSIGLSHSNHTGSVMYATNSYNPLYVIRFDASDQKAIKDLYPPP